MMLGLLARFGPYVAIGLLSLGLYAVIKQNGALKANLDNAIEIANANAAVAEEERVARQKADQVASDNAKQIESIRKKYSAKRNEVARAPKTQDGELSPILRGVLDGLPKPPPPVRKDDGAARRTGAPVSLPGWSL